MLIKNAELDGRHVVDIRCKGGIVDEIACSLQALPTECLIDARGGALLPGLHDHHIHLHAQAASQSSVICGPPQVTNVDQLEEALNGENGGGWIRGIAYHDSVAGELDRWRLDRLVADRPVRIQHRSGKLWILNSAAAQMIELDRNAEMAGVECDDEGCPNGRLFRLDDWLRSKMDQCGRPGLEFLSRQLASYGVTGVTDATPRNSLEEVAVFVRAIEENQLLQRILIMGDLQLPLPKHKFATRGAYKILLDESQLPEFDWFVEHIAFAHSQQRPVAIHCVTKTELIFTLSALIVAGHLPGDRIEHASVTPNDALPLLREARVAVVTQFGFIWERGDQYLEEVTPQHHNLLYRGRTFLDAGVPLAGSSDAPYGSPDPWLVMRAAVARTSVSGRTIGAGEKLSPEQALALFTTSPERPGSSPRTIVKGEAADVCLLDRGWNSARNRLDSRDVVASIRGGELIYCR